MSFSVDPHGLRSAGRVLEDAGAAAGGELRRQQGRTVAATGLGVDAVHQALAAATAEAVELVVAALTRSGTGMQRMADAYERADDAVGDGFRRLG